MLVIDDERAVREALALFLATEGCTTIEADGGDEAVSALSRGDTEPDAIVCDYRLRDDERGTQAIARVRAHAGRDIPAVLVTGDTGADRLREIGASGFEVLHKPCDPAELMHRIRAAAAGRGGADAGSAGYCRR